jgi:predicted nucleic acid-binding Zn finger protein
MAESKLLTLPPQAKSPPPKPEENPLLVLRRRRAVALMPTVRSVEGGFRVSSSSREIRYLVTQPNGHRVCTCPDFWRHEEVPGFKCKHVIAVDMAQESGQRNVSRTLRQLGVGI